MNFKARMNHFSFSLNQSVESDRRLTLLKPYSFGRLNRGAAWIVGSDYLVVNAP